MKTMSKTQASFIVIFVILAIIFGPLITIWALNTLFNLGIAYGFWEWLAIVVLSSVINGSKYVRIKN